MCFLPLWAGAQKCIRCDSIFVVWGAEIEKVLSVQIYLSGTATTTQWQPNISKDAISNNNGESWWPKMCPKFVSKTKEEHVMGWRREKSRCLI